MLSRTADHLYWMARYIERAENTARLLDIAYQTTLQPQSAVEAEQTWRSLLSISELNALHASGYTDVDARSVMKFFVADENNLSSVFNCLRASRENARAVRGSLTTEVWETTNQTWLEFRKLLKADWLRDPGALFEWIKYRSHLSRGVTVGTMLQDEAFHFIRIGSFLERADNTARLLDVKFYDEGHAPAEREAARDFYYWSAVLRSVSGFEIYRKVYSNVIQPDKVAELLILRQDMPRSLAHCMSRLVGNLKRVANPQSTETLRRAGRLEAALNFGRIDEILATGLHTYLDDFLAKVADLGNDISNDFLV
ncbi:alpha-E domain-containing protein [Roseateles asaccharophilus]|uniref:Alpha-E superfamily protein n=1 Tax=Roseateles asaccharophilus TaxID=582607 RepID=A0ABU2A760_9BURK|nr:alpha-E domain-containing protein [Roseateles asaccharophilus]MDR7333037.1 putative alpha-E superfamily protein [Roseateles asaccharophilus]